MEITFKDLIKAIAKKWYILVLAILLAALLGGLISKYVITKKYQSETTAYIFIQPIDNESADLMTENIATEHFVVLATMDPVYKAIAEEMGAGYDPDDLKKMFKVTRTNKDLNVVTTVCTAKDPKEAQKLLQAFNRVMTEKLPELPFDGEKIIMKVTNDPSYREKPTSPNVTLNTVIAALIGAVVGFLIILILRLRNTVVQNSEDLVETFNVTVIAEIPEYTEKKRGYHVYQ